MASLARSALGPVVFALAACTAAVDPGEDPDPPDPELVNFDIEDTVVLSDDLGASWSCDGEDEPSNCMDDYLAVAHRTLDDDFDLDACRAQVVRQAEELWAVVEVEWAPPNYWSTDELREGILEAIALPELHALRPANPELHVRVISSETLDGHIDSFLVIEDPLLGDVPARRLTPLVQGPNPAILVLPGHPSQPDPTVEFADDNHGRLLARAGYDVMILSQRAYNGLPEHLATTSMLCAGLSMVAVRHLEALLLKRVLQHLQDEGTVGPIALMGHSGGAVQSNALARWDESFDAYVTDHFWPYVDVGLCLGDDDSSCVADSHCPDLLPYATAIEDDPGWAMPTHIQDYGYPDPDALIAFLDETIGSGKM